MADKLAAYLYPMMRGRDLAHEVVEGLDPDVVRIESEDPTDLSGRDVAELRDDHLDDETAARRQVRRVLRSHLMETTVTSLARTGLVVQVPLFVNTGDRVKVDTRTGEYMTRA